jgi:uncharacterized protein YcbK (DUF882 family)
VKSIKIPGISMPVALDAPISFNSPHFSWAEATKSGARIPESEAITARIIRLANELEDVRNLFGDRIITITSWYRPIGINRRVGGRSNSRHLLGDAVDIIIQGIDPRHVAKEMSKSWVGGVGDNAAFTHLDLGANRRWNY